MAVYDDIVFSVVKDADTFLSWKLEADVLYFNAPIGMHLFSWFRETIEKMAYSEPKKEAIAIFLTTPGGQAEVAEKFVEVIRSHYKLVYFIVPVAAMSAGTILCMAGDKIYMDYSSSLGPIDPQVLDKEGKGLVPALGYLDKMNELIEKAKEETITPLEYQWFQNQDFASLSLYEQARDLSVDLLKKWLVEYKFKNWTEHRTHNQGTQVTREEKEQRAKEIGELLSNNRYWHSHGRMIGLKTLQEICRLEIDDYGQDPKLQKQIRRYNDLLSDYVSRAGNPPYLYAEKAM